MGAVKGCTLMAAWATPELYAQLQALAQLSGTTQSAVLRALVAQAADRAAVAGDLPTARRATAPGNSLAASGAVAA